MNYVELLDISSKAGIEIPLFTMSVPAGYPNVIEPDVDKVVDLNEFLIEHPATTLFARVTGDFGKGAEIKNGDILIVDTGIEPDDGKYVIVSVNGEMTVKIFREIDNEKYLISANLSFMPLMREEFINHQLIGVVKKVIHSL
ncbi:MAG: LexA family transcriptional regulator [Candidatus Kapabacteria bacterium]|nr:LexA family transcriptional regulator [Candidatus Kapabacteria bacterium]